MTNDKQGGLFADDTGKPHPGGKLHLHQAIVQYEKGMDAVEKGQLEQAKTAFTKVLQIEPTFIEAYAALGTVQGQLEEFTEAKQTLTRALQIEPDHPAILGAMVFNSLAMGDVAEASRLIDRALPKLPQDVSFLTSLVDLCLAIGQPKLALKILRHAEKLEPNSPDVHSLQGMAYSDDRQMKKAIAEFSKVVELLPEDSDAVADLGMAYLTNTDWQRAADSFGSAVQLDPENAFAHAGLGATHVELGRTEDARTEAALVERLTDEDTHALMIAGQIYSRLGMLPEAQRVFQHVFLLEPENTNAFMNLVQTTVQVGGVPALRSLLTQVPGITPQMADALVDSLNLEEEPSAPRGKKPARSAGPVMVYQLKITLQGTKPPIWRRVLVKSDTKLSSLHRIIQAVMGWTDSHLHAFTIDHVSYAEPAAKLGYVNEKQVILGDVVVKEKQKFTYTYDFGDSWEHVITVEKIQPVEEGVRYPVCVDGKLAAPPEDCGGIPGFYDLLDAIRNPNNPEHEELLEWVGEGYDPTYFACADVERDLKRIK